MKSATDLVYSESNQALKILVQMLWYLQTAGRETSTLFSMANKLAAKELPDMTLIKEHIPAGLLAKRKATVSNLNRIAKVWQGNIPANVVLTPKDNDYDEDKTLYETVDET